MVLYSTKNVKGGFIGARVVVELVVHIVFKMLDVPLFSILHLLIHL